MEALCLASSPSSSSPSASEDKEWFKEPKGWLMKPDFKRSAQQRRATIDTGMLKNFSVKSFFSHGYKRRWFILRTETSILEYFESDVIGRSRSSRLGYIDLSSIQQLRPSELFDAPAYSIDLCAADQVYTLAGDTAEDISKWNIALSRELAKLQFQREIRLTRISPGKVAVGFKSKPDFSPSELVKTVMSFADNNHYLRPVVRAFYSKLVQFLLTPNAPIDGASIESESSEILGLNSAKEAKAQLKPALSSASISSVDSSFAPSSLTNRVRRSSFTVGSCHFPGCCNSHFNRSLFCREHQDCSDRPGAESITGTMVATPTIVSICGSNSNLSDAKLSAAAVSLPARSTTEDREGQRRVRNEVVASASPTAAPQELNILTVTSGHVSTQYHLKRLSLRERAQELANIKCEDIEVSEEVIEEALDLARSGSLPLSLFEKSEWGHMLMQFRQMDDNNDGKITINDIRLLVHKIDRTWATSDDPQMQAYLDSSADEWIKSASVDGSKEMDFAGFVNALMKRRGEETSNYGLGEDVTIPLELLQHPFWDLRTVMCTTCTIELSGWMLKRGYAIPKSALNAWHLRYFVLVLRDGYPYLEYWDGYQPSELQNEDSLRLSFPAINRCISSLTDSMTREVAISQIMREQSQAERAVSAALAAVDAGNTHTNRMANQANRQGGLRYRGNLDASRIHNENNATLKGVIDVRDIVQFDFSPKTVVKMSDEVIEEIARRELLFEQLTVIKILTKTGRNYVLACGEEMAVNWMSELIRFSSRYHAEADWRRNWGGERQQTVCLRDWLNASSVVGKLSNYCVAHHRAGEMLAQAQSFQSMEQGGFDMDLAKRSLRQMLRDESLTPKEFSTFEVVGVDIGSNNVVNERLSITNICELILHGIKNSYSFEFSGIFSASQYMSKFGLTTEFELASLNNSSEIIEHSSSWKRRKDGYFDSTHCHICKRKYKNISLRNSLRRHICRLCGTSCCSVCCSTKIFDDRIGVYVEICIRCAFT